MKGEGRKPKRARPVLTRDDMLREGFAMAALHGFVTAAAFNQEAEDTLKRCGVKPGEITDFIAMMSWDFADAMLRERAKRNGGPR